MSSPKTSLEEESTKKDEEKARNTLEIGVVFPGCAKQC